MKQTKEIKLPRFMFEHDSSVQQIINEGQEFYVIEKIIIDRGIYTYLKGVDIPQKGFAEPQVIWAINMAKRYIIEPAKILSKWHFFGAFFLISICTPKSKIRLLQGILEGYNRVAYAPLSGHIMKQDFLCPVSQEIRKFISVFLIELGVQKNTADQFAKIFAHIIQYDNAYRYRIQDLMSETTKAKVVANPKKEVRRLVGLLYQRDDKNIADKINSFIRIGMFFMFGKVKKAFINAIKSVEVERMGFDEADRYWVSIRTDYKFFGLEYDKRMELVKDLKKPIPVKI